MFFPSLYDIRLPVHLTPTYHISLPGLTFTHRQSIAPLAVVTMILRQNYSRLGPTFDRSFLCRVLRAAAVAQVQV